MCAADLAEHRDQHVEDAERGDGVPEQRNAVVGGQLVGLDPAPHDGGYKQRRSHSLGNQLPSERKDGLLLLVRQGMVRTVPLRNFRSQEPERVAGWGRSG